MGVRSPPSCCSEHVSSVPSFLTSCENMYEACLNDGPAPAPTAHSLAFFHLRVPPARLAPHAQHRLAHKQQPPPGLISSHTGRARDAKGNADANRLCTNLLSLAKWQALSA
jgi:hypothetical protein